MAGLKRRIHVGKGLPFFMCAQYGRNLIGESP